MKLAIDLLATNGLEKQLIKRLKKKIKMSISNGVIDFFEDQVLPAV